MPCFPKIIMDILYPNKKTGGISFWEIPLSSFVSRLL